MKFLALVKSSEKYRTEGPPPALMEAMGKYVQESFASGRVVDTGGLKSSAAAMRLRVEHGKLTVTDGPFTEAKEVVGGFWLMQAKSKEEVVEWVKRCPATGSEMIEIRQVFEAEDFGPALTPELREAEERLRKQSGMQGR